MVSSGISDVCFSILREYLSEEVDNENYDYTL